MLAHRFRLHRAAILIGVLLGATLTDGVLRAATADDDATVNQIIELNKKALVLYGNLDVAGAAEALEQALALCSGADLGNRPAAARTHLHLGLVYVSGLKKREEGLAEFKRALAIDPRIKIAKSLLNPEVEAAFAEAAATPNPPAVDTPSSGTAGSSGSPGQPPAPMTVAPLRRERLALQHPPVTRAIRGRPVAIKVQVPPGLGASKVVLAYQGEDNDVFLAREMVPIKGAAGWYEEEIPGEATRGAHVDYYLEAQNPDDQAIASHGSPEQAHRIALAPELAAEEVRPPRPAPGDARTGAMAAPGLWLVLALGSGGGYHTGKPEMNPVDNNTPQGEIHVSGFGLARLGHLAPEIGFFPTEAMVLSVQGRIQNVSGTQDVVLGQASTTYHPAQYAVAGLAKLTWFLRKPQRRLRPFVVAQAGAGQIRHTITTPAGANLTGCGDGPTCKDTVMGGLALAGVGAGMIWRLDENLAAYAAFSLLAGAPNLMVNGDLNVGIAVIR